MCERSDIIAKVYTTIQYSISIAKIVRELTNFTCNDLNHCFITWKLHIYDHSKKLNTSALTKTLEKL